MSGGAVVSYTIRFLLGGFVGLALGMTLERMVDSYSCPHPRICLGPTKPADMHPRAAAKPEIGTNGTSSVSMIVTPISVSPVVCSLSVDGEISMAEYPPAGGIHYLAHRDRRGNWFLPGTKFEAVRQLGRTWNDDGLSDACVLSAVETSAQAGVLVCVRKSP